MRLRPCRRRVRITSLLLAFPAIITVVVIIALQQPNAKQDGDVMVLLRNDKKQKEYIDKRGIHVIVGHYIGNELPWDPKPNLTKDFLNLNGYSPIHGAGDMGQAYYVPLPEKNKMKTLFQINKFNLLASDRISVNRSLPDVRRQSCRDKDYSLSSLGDTSVIIVFHNEAWSTLIRTIHSIINRSPPRLLKEIILVDDASEREFLKKPLDNYASQLLVPIQIVRAINRTGLVRARLLGARVARGKVLTFLDAHCECTKGWLEPLLSEIVKDRTKVVCPVIDIIHEDTFAYVRSFELHWGAFNWELHFRWYPISEREILRRGNNTISPIRTPVMAGGLFAIDKSYFEEIGKYDEKMDIWGGENIEISLRIWQCGGSIEIAPCSHVGHVFRRSSPYTFPRPGGVGAVLYANLARAAKVWMDEWQNFYFKINPDAGKIYTQTDVTDRLLLRKKLKCKNFKWYLENVWPEHFLPTDDRFFGKIRNKKNGKCFQKHGAKGGQHPVGKVQLGACVFEVYPQQYFVFTKAGQIMTDESVCLDSTEGIANTNVVMMACNGYERQKWNYDLQQQTLIHVKSKLCLDLPSKRNPDGLTLQTCQGTSNQQWIFETMDWKLA